MIAVWMRTELLDDAASWTTWENTDETYATEDDARARHSDDHGIEFMFLEVGEVPTNH